MDASKLKEFRDGARAIEDYIISLNRWEKNIKEEDKKLMEICAQQRNHDLSEEFPIRSKARELLMSEGKREEVEKKDPMKSVIGGKSKINAYDYAAWDKYDADAAAEEVDKFTPNQNIKSLSSDSTPSSNLKQTRQISSTEPPASTDEAKIKALKLKDEGNELFSAGKYADAIKVYSTGLSLDSSNHILYANRAMAYIKLEDGRAAERDCNVCISLCPDYLKAYLRRGVARLLQDKLQLALEDYNKVLTVEPFNKDAKFHVSQIEQKLASVKQTSKPPSSHENKSSFEILAANRSQKPLTKVDIIELNKESQVPPFTRAMISPSTRAQDTAALTSHQRVDPAATSSNENISTSEVIRVETHPNSPIANIPTSPTTEAKAVNFSEKQFIEPDSCSRICKSEHDAQCEPMTKSSQLKCVESEPLAESFSKFTQESASPQIFVATSDSLQKSEESKLPLPSVPRTSHQFMTVWARLVSASPDLALQWLQQSMKASLLRKFELETECIGSLVQQLLRLRKAVQESSDASYVDTFVIALTESRGFDLQVLFLEETRKNDFLELLELMEASQRSLPAKLVALKQAIISP
ncbi:RNA polymerase II-associated protein 3 [Hyalella azteca]|uniref:RNA polymerase II-associated protein 3 n=1 Tax=Hyalella azteca TaxID=294128 RepID=A0A8B7N4I3_HYAAZ|nr:RNA polymerase II-associated protein 3 [Hyalella azteca]